MKKIIIFCVFTSLVMMAAIVIPSFAGKIGSDCTFKGKKMYGKVKVTTTFPDFKVKIVSRGADLKVKPVNSFPSSCGKWEFEDTFPDFKIQFVDSFEDFSIQFEESFPGVP